MKRILVTGGAGYIGSAVVDLLAGAGFEPVVLDTFYWGKESVAHLGDRVTLLEGDVRSSRDLIYAVQDVDAVVHLAGIVGQAACAQNPRAHFTTNVEATRTLLNCITDPEMPLVRDFIFLSSCSVYGNVAGIHDKVDEETPARPLSEYADGKLRAERAIWETAARVPHFCPTILRLTTIFGWSYRLRLDLVANMFVSKALRDGKLTIFGSGLQYRSLIHVRDVARAVLAAVTAPRYVRDRQVFHVGEEGNNVTVKDLAECVCEHVPGADIEYREQADTDRRDYRIDCQKIKNVLGWHAEYGVADGIAELAEKLRERGDELDSPAYRNDRIEYV